MFQKIILFYILFINISYSTLNVTNFITLPLINNITESELDDFNSYINDCDRLLENYSDNDRFVKQNPDLPMSGNECGKQGQKECKKIGDYRGIQDIKNAKTVKKVALIDGPANLRREPKGILLKVTLENHSFVLITRELDDWRFVTDGDNAGWTHLKNLLPGPKKIYVKKNKGIDEKGKGLEKAIGIWKTLKKEHQYELELAKDKPVCPKDMSPFDEDGLISGRYGWTFGYQLLVKCGGTKYPEDLPKVVSVSLKNKECDCYSGNGVDGYLDSPIKINKASADFKIQPNDKEENCRLGKHFIMCDKPGYCYNHPPDQECSMPKMDQLICPKECLIWKQK